MAVLGDVSFFDTLVIQMPRQKGDMAYVMSPFNLLLNCITGLLSSKIAAITLRGSVRWAPRTSISA